MRQHYPPAGHAGCRTTLNSGIEQPLTKDTPESSQYAHSTNSATQAHAFSCSPDSEHSAGQIGFDFGCVWSIANSFYCGRGHDHLNKNRHATNIYFTKI